MIGADEPGVVLVGGGVGSVSVARRLRAIEYSGPVTLVSDETVPPYDRPPLSKQYLAGSLRTDEAALLRPGEVEELGVTMLRGRRATGLDTASRELLLDGSVHVPYRILVAATGARARRLPIGQECLNVHYLRTLADAKRLRKQLRPGRRLIVIGAGFIGLEVAATAHALGVEVTVLEAAPHPLTRVLGPTAGALVTSLHAERVGLRFGAQVTGFVGEHRVRAVCVDGIELPADVVVVGIGAVPNAEWLDGSGLVVDDGVVCDEGGRSSAPGVYAVGDVARWRHLPTGTHHRVEQWQTAVEQAAVVAANIAVDLGVPQAAPESWESVPYFWSDQYEHKIQFCGRPGMVSSDRPVRQGVVACFADAPDGIATGVLSIDNPGALARGRRMVAAGTSWPDMVTWLRSL